jgi:dipeptidyl aminopeptidase/acylaminoacyl peptidase
MTCHFSRPGALARWMLLILAACFAMNAGAGVRKVEPGEAIELSGDEGLLVVAVDTSLTLNRVRVRRDGDWFDGGTLRNVAPGQTYQLYIVPQGTYRYSEVNNGWARYRFPDNDDHAFTVKSGVVNYPGHLIYRPTGLLRVMLHMTNRSLLTMDWLAREHPRLPSGLQLEYTGRYPDPFPSLYRAASAGRPPAKDATKAPPKPRKLPIPIEDLWRASRVRFAELNDAGDLLAVATTEEVKEEWVDRVEIIDLATSTAKRVLESPMEIRTLDWSGDILVSSLDASELHDAVFLIKPSAAKPGAARSFERYHVPRAGLLVDPLPGDPGHILFSSIRDGGRGNKRMLHRLDIRSREWLENFEFKYKTAINDGTEDAVRWFADAQGRVRAALAIRDEEPVLLHGADGKYKTVLSLGESAVFSPIALSRDGNLFYGWSEKDRAQRDLVEFDPVTGKIGKTLFSRPGADVQSAIFDPERNLIGAQIFEEGQLVSHFFDAGSAELAARLQQAFPGQTVSILDRDASAANFVLLVRGSDTPPRVYHFDAKAKRASLIEETRPWLSEYRFAPAHVVKATSKDGLPVEAYLTLPAAKPGEKVPLVLFPHGGPIGVRDSLQFDPEVQFLASLGYAVLQVNFRGSEGFGRAFREAGQGSYGTLIEDDIDAALRVALASHPLDEKRMCAFGASYGGYSALVSAIRWPGRFRCAISMSGISDQALFFTASDSASSGQVRELMEKAIGDPRKSLAAMQEKSPLYRIESLDLPVMLVHGTEDYRVDPEHARRLIRMLNLAGRPPTVLMLEGAGHGIVKAEQRQQVWEGIAGFLQQHL